MLTMEESTYAERATSCLVGCMIMEGTSLRYIQTAKNETINATYAVSLLLVCIISTGTINYIHLHSIIRAKCVSVCLLMPAASGCTVLCITMRGLLHAVCATNRSGKRLFWKSMFVCILVKNLLLVKSVSIHSGMCGHWMCILVVTQERSHLRVMCVTSHSLGNIISCFIFKGGMVVKYGQVHGVTCLRQVRKSCWMEDMHVQCVTKSSGRSAIWKPICLYILVKIPVAIWQF